MASPFLSRIPNHPSFARALGAVVFACSLLVGEWMVHLQQRELETRARLDTLADVGGLRARVDRELNTVLFQSSTLASYLAVRKGRVDPVELEAILADLYRNSRHVRNFGLAVGLRLSYVYPHQNNDSARGLYYPDHPDQWAAVKRTIDSGHSVLSGPIRLVQGGLGLAYRVPVYVDGRYWGLLSTVIDIESLFRSALSAEGASSADYAIRTRALPGEPAAMLWGDERIFELPTAVTLDADLMQGQWQYAARLQPPAQAGGYLIAMRLMAWSLALLLGFATCATLRHRYDLAQLALFDPLTRLPNRRHFEQNLSQTLERRRKSDARHCALLFIDLDRFKTVNDTFGHKAGDAVLQVVAERVRREMRAGDTIGRWGGDELVAVVDETDDEALAALQARLTAAISLPIDWEGQQLRIGVSIGSAIYPQDGSDARALFKVADARMYDEKQRHYHPAAVPRQV